MNEDTKRKLNFLRGKIKLQPIYESIQLLDISDDEYFSPKYAEYISNSKLGLINPEQNGNRQLYIEGFGSQQVSDSLLFGSCIHQSILQPDDYEMIDNIDRPSAKMGFMADNIISFRDKGYSIYNSIIAASNKINYYKGKLTDSRFDEVVKKCYKYYIQYRRFVKNNTSSKIPMFLDKSTRDKFYLCKYSIDTNRLISAKLNPAYIVEKPLSINEGTLLMDVKATTDEGKEYTIRLKAKLDNFTIDTESQIVTLNDVKTTRHKVSDFRESFEQYHYYRQLGMYMYMLSIYVRYKYKFKPKFNYGNFLIVSTVPDYESGVYAARNSDFERGMEEFSYLLRLVVWEIYMKRDCLVDAFEL